MSLCFVDRDNRPTSQEAWEALFRDPAYDPTLWLECGPGWEVEARWVGVSSSMEARRCPFVVEAHRVRTEIGKDGEEKQVRTQIEERWCASAEEARIVFVEMLENTA